MKFIVIDVKTGAVLDADAIVTAFMLADWPGRTGDAVLRGRCWSAVNYPGFMVEPGEQVLRIKIRETT